MAEHQVDHGELVALLDAAARLDASEAEVARARAVVDRLFAAHQDRIYTLCVRILGDRERAREVAQDTFLTAYRKLGEYQGTGSFYSWLYGIAKFKCFNAVKKSGDLLTEDGVLDDTDPERGVYRDLRRAERLAVFQQAASAVLDPLEQEAVHLRYARGLSQERITEVLQIAEASGARGVLQRCRRKLARELRRRLQELGHGPSFFAESVS